MILDTLTTTCVYFLVQQFRVKLKDSGRAGDQGKRLLGTVPLCTIQHDTATPVALLLLEQSTTTMSEAKLDQIVKGAPRPDTSLQQVAAAAASQPPSSELADEIQESKKPTTYIAPSDPLSTLPSSPPQVYLNLLILEASLRSQYLALHGRRRQHTFFLLLLAIWIAYFFHALFLRPREDGKGRGGSVYWVIDMGEKVAFMGGVLTAILIWATGQWERGMRWPRRWVGTANRGLRGMNLKIVMLRKPWWRQMLSGLSFLFPYPLFFTSQGSSFRIFEFSEKRDSSTTKYSYRDESSQIPGMREEDVAPGGDYVKILLLPKQFSAEFRENWELYRTEYWEKENERRADLRSIVKKRERVIAKQQGGWLWWTGLRVWKSKSEPVGDIEKHHHTHHKQSTDLQKRAVKLQTTQSRPSSISSTATYESNNPGLGADLVSRSGSGRRNRPLPISSTRHTRPSSRMIHTGSEDGLYSSSVENVPTLTKRGSSMSSAGSSTSDGEPSRESSVFTSASKRIRERDLAMSNAMDD